MKILGFRVITACEDALLAEATVKTYRRRDEDNIRFRKQ